MIIIIIHSIQGRNMLKYTNIEPTIYSSFFNLNLPSITAKMLYKYKLPNTTAKHSAPTNIIAICSPSPPLITIKSKVAGIGAISIYFNLSK